MAIPSTGIQFQDWRPAAPVNASAARAADTEGARDWSRLLMDQEKVQARASLRPDTAAAIKAAQSVWLASQQTPVSGSGFSDTERDIETLISMLVDQASGAKHRI